MPITLTSHGATNSISNKQGWEYIKHVEWDESYVTHVDLSLDTDRYTNFILTWWVTGRENVSNLHYKTASGSHSSTNLVFLRNSSIEGAFNGVEDDITNSYNQVYVGSNAYHASAFAGGPSYSYQVDNKAWLGSGDGQYWVGKGTALISVPPYSNYDSTSSRAAVHSWGGLSNDVGTPTNDSTYVMDAATTYKRDDSKSWQIRGIRLVGSAFPTDKYLSRKGWVLLQGIKR